jgi:concanavalin A-like lectin/glucanase superfamily protein
MTLWQIIVWAFLLSGSTVNAAGYEPDILDFTETSDLDFSGDPAFSLAEQATLEIWVAAGWQNDPGYDPVLLYHADQDSILYTLAMLGDQSGLTLQAGDVVDELPFSFTDGLLHHVALINLGESVALMVDGQVVGRFNIRLPATVGTTFRLGSAPGPSMAFEGAIGGLRIWDIAVQRDSLINYALTDIFSTTDPHPDLDSLTAYSDLHNNTIDITPGEEELL